MIKQSSSEETKQTDPFTGKKIHVSTSARLIYRKLHPEWVKEKVSNLILNEEIAKQFAAAPVTEIFLSKKNKSESGDIRGTESSKFVSIHRSNYVLVIAAKGSHNLPSPPLREKKLTSVKLASSITKSAEGRDDSLRAHRGWLEDHYFCLFIGQAALDEKSTALLKDYIKNNGGMKAVKNMTPDQASQVASDQASQMARTMLSEDQRGQLTREPGMLNDRPGNLSVPFSFPLE
jgi:hypothetical protein